MTHLYCNGQEVSLPDDFQFSLTQENPFFLRSGSYTYDLEISLIDSKNANIFKKIHRINNLKDWERIDAKIYDDCTCVLNGTCLILDITDESAVIQVVGEESELNAFINNEELISSLDMGDISAEDIAKAKINYKTLSDDWRNQSFCLPMVKMTPVKSEEPNLYKEFWANLIDFSTLVSHPSVDLGNSKWYPFYNTTGEIFMLNEIPMPYLLKYAERILKTLGYNVTDSFARNTDDNYLFFANVTHTRKWSEMLPGWTIKDFFEEIEKFFRCTFFVDFNKNISIYNINSLLKFDTVIQLNRVGVWTKTKSFNDEQETKSFIENNGLNAKYDFNTDKSDIEVREISEDILRFYTIKETTIVALREKLQSSDGITELQSEKKIYKCIDFDQRLFIIDDTGTLREINRFGEHKDNDVENSAEFKITPISETVGPLNDYMVSAESIESEAIPDTPWLAIKEGMPSINKLERILIAYQDELNWHWQREPTLASDYGQFLYAIPRIDNKNIIVESLKKENKHWLSEKPYLSESKSITSSLSLNAENGVISRLFKRVNEKLDIETEYSTEVEINSMIDVRTKINIDNVIFNIISIEYIFTKNGLSNTAKIKLVRVK